MKKALHPDKNSCAFSAAYIFIQIDRLNSSKTQDILKIA
jgi:hypothetical protein